ncbi:unnamed protein product [Clonostachys solani]|uniref:Uncharacterized protein n=1 Tax=Clonostachys solani TaxID=160281 RepID=A0A9N9ZMA1_9HYPO|nr:unnamed protein product [Clonostachys solani]
MMSRSSSTEAIPRTNRRRATSYLYLAPRPVYVSTSLIDNQREHPPRQSLFSAFSDEQSPYLQNHPLAPSEFETVFSSIFSSAPPRPTSLPPLGPHFSPPEPALVPIPTATAAPSQSEASNLAVPSTTASPPLTLAPPPSSTTSMSISSTKYRVGQPPVRPLPLENAYDVAGVCSPDELDKLYERVADILASHEIKRPELREPTGPWDSDDGSDDFICLVYRSVPGVPDSDRLTLLITAEWTDSSATNWKLAVQDIRPFVVSRLGQQVHVEMIATYLTTPREIGPLGHHPLIQDNWDAICGKIQKVLQSHPASRDNVTLVTVFRMGYHKKIEDNPVTVYVSVTHDCPEASWPPIIDGINEILEPYPVELFFEHNYWTPTAFELRPPSSGKSFRKEFVRRPYQERPDLGADISPAQYIEHDGQKQNPMLGTLGCYVDFKTRHGEQKTMALTDYHVCRPCVPGYTLEETADEGKPNGMPLPGSLLKTLDRSGIDPDHAHVVSDMEHPSRQRHNINVAGLNASLEKNPKGRIRSLVETRLGIAQRAFHEDANILGKVWAASGFDHRGTADDSFVEWALIEVQPNRRGSNRLPGLSAWESLYEFVDWPDEEEGMGSLKMYRHDTTLGTLEPGTKVFKYGAATGLTVGHYQQLRSVVGPSMLNANPSRATTMAYLVERVGDRQFSGPGDSGAVVYDQEGHALGLVYRRFRPSVTTLKQGDYFTWVIAMDQIFEDIERFCGVTDLRISPPVGSPPN